METGYVVVLDYKPNSAEDPWPTRFYYSRETDSTLDPQKACLFDTKASAEAQAACERNLTDVPCTVAVMPMTR